MTVSALTTDNPFLAIATVPATTLPVTLSRARRRNPQQRMPSPCVGVCKMDEVNGWCAGCFRTIEELTAWSSATDAAKLAVWSLVEQRQASSR